MTKRKPGSTQRYRHDWTPEEESVLTRRYPNERAQAIADDLGIHVTQVYKRAVKLGLSKSESFYQSEAAGLSDGRGAGTRFKPGQKSWNKGTKGIAGQHPNCRRSQFKKGEKYGAAQHNYVPIGTEKISADGYLIRKITDDPTLVPARRWEAVHRLVWIAANGPIPSGHVVGFLPGRNTTDLEKITLDALELVSRKDLALRNHPVSRSPELAKLVQLKGAITRQVNRLAREAKEQES
jgi:hypothetical protein